MQRYSPHSSLLVTLRHYVYVIGDQLYHNFPFFNLLIATKTLQKKFPQKCYCELKAVIGEEMVLHYGDDL